jgi:hypothetical protein
VSRRVTRCTLVGAGLVVCLALVFLVSPHASSAPDGLIRVAADHRLDSGATRAPFFVGPLAGYQVHGVGGRGLARGVAGGIGVIAAFALASVGAGLLAARRSRPPT